MKKILNFLSKFALSILVVCYLLIAPNFILKKLLLEQDALINAQENTYYGVIDMWHIESFEGGSVARSSWLQKRAQEFEKKNKGVYISITTMTQETAKLNLQNGKKPSLISFSLGLGDELKELLLTYEGKKIGLEKLLLAGKYNNKQLAVPYMMGGYCGFNLSKQNILSGLNSYSLTSFALAQTLTTYNTKLNVEKNSFSFDSYNAYASFIKGKSDGLFGTQRDFYRLNNRISNGSMQEGEFEFFGFSDLVQYVGICKGVSEDVYSLSQSFIEYLLSLKSQNTLTDINMFSVLENSENTSDKNFSEFQNTVKNNLNTVNVFLNSQEINEINETSKKYLKGEINSIEVLKKYII